MTKAPPRWTEQEINLIRELYPFEAAETFAAQTTHTAQAIRRKAFTLGIKKIVPAPRNWRPIGSERMDRGILIRKVTDTGQPKKDWKRVDVIEWEAVHGPIPEGYTLMLKDSSLPRTLENLALYTREEHWQRSSVQRLPPEAVVLVQLKGQITQAINRRLRAEKSARSPASANT